MPGHAGPVETAAELAERFDRRAPEYDGSAMHRGLAQAVADFEVPVGLGLLTCDTMAQAEARAGGTYGNKGWDAALAALEMVDLFERLDLTHGGGDDEEHADESGDDGLED